MTPAANIETKARCTDLKLAAARAKNEGAVFASTLTQEDTYFDVNAGRLKLRIVEDQPADGTPLSHAELISYQRPNNDGARISEYTIDAVEEPHAELERLSSEHGLRGVVTKVRDLWLLGSTRIHLDQVTGLGGFVELETVLDGRPEAVLWAEHRRIAEGLQLSAEDYVAGSYVDLLEFERIHQQRSPKKGCA